MKLYNNKKENERVKIQLEFEYSSLLGTVKESLGALALETGLRTVQLLQERQT